MTRLNFVILMLTITLGLAASTTLAGNNSVFALPAKLQSTIDPAVVSGEFLRLGFTSEGVSNYNAVIGRIVSTVAAFQSNRGTADIYYIFPAPTRSTPVESAYFYILDRTGTYPANATLTLKVYNYAGVSQRTLSTAAVNLQAAPTGVWTPLALSTTGLTLAPGEFLAFHANFSGGSGGSLNVRPVFEVQLGPGTTAVTQRTTYLPAILKDVPAPPDLVISNLSATSGIVSLTLRNQGSTPVTDAFWVDVYFNPSVTPSLNKRWQDIAPKGAVWGVSGAGLSQLTPGGSLNLTSGDSFYFPNLSSTPPWPVGANVFGQVDSLNFSTTYGAVRESNEANNVFGPIISTAGPIPPADPADKPATVATDLPARD